MLDLRISKLNKRVYTEYFKLDNIELNYKLFGDNEWSGVDRANYLDNLKERIEADSYQGGA